MIDKLIAAIARELEIVIRSSSMTQVRHASFMYNQFDSESLIPNLTPFFGEQSPDPYPGAFVVPSPGPHIHITPDWKQKWHPPFGRQQHQFATALL